MCEVGGVTDTETLFDLEDLRSKTSFCIGIFGAAVLSTFTDPGLYRVCHSALFDRIVFLLPDQEFARTVVGRRGWRRTIFDDFDSSSCHVLCSSLWRRC